MTIHATVGSGPACISSQQQPTQPILNTSKTAPAVHDAKQRRTAGDGVTQPNDALTSVRSQATAGRQPLSEPQKNRVLFERVILHTPVFRQYLKTSEVLSLAAALPLSHSSLARDDMRQRELAEILQVDPAWLGKRAAALCPDSTEDDTTIAVHWKQLTKEVASSYLIGETALPTAAFRTDIYLFMDALIPGIATSIFQTKSSDIIYSVAAKHDTTLIITSLINFIVSFSSLVYLAKVVLSGHRANQISPAQYRHALAISAITIYFTFTFARELNERIMLFKAHWTAFCHTKNLTHFDMMIKTVKPGTPDIPGRFDYAKSFPNYFCLKPRDTAHIQGIYES